MPHDPRDSLEDGALSARRLENLLQGIRFRPRDGGRKILDRLRESSGGPLDLLSWGDLAGLALAFLLMGLALYAFWSRLLSLRPSPR